MYITCLTNRLLVAINILLQSCTLNFLYPPVSGDSMTIRNLKTLRTIWNRVLVTTTKSFTRLSGIPIILLPSYEMINRVANTIQTVFDYSTDHFAVALQTFYFYFTKSKSQPYNYFVNNELSPLIY